MQPKHLVVLSDLVCIARLRREALKVEQDSRVREYAITSQSRS